MTCPFVARICTKCKQILIIYSNNFSKDKKGKFGYSSQCKKCRNKYKRKWNEDNKEHINEWNKNYNDIHKEEINERCKMYVETHKEEVAKRKHEWYVKNKDKCSEKNKKYRIENPHIDFNNHSRRREREENQGNGITKEQWLEMMNFFNWRCAYSDIGLNEKNRTIDHIIPLDKNGEHEIWNCVPCFNSYNYSKSTKDMLEWYKQQDFFSEERLQKIYEWIEYAKDIYKR